VFCAYVLRLPDGTPFYVGMGAKKRARDLPHNNAEAISIVVGLRTQGQKYVRTKEEFDTKEDAQARELELIQKWGRRVDGGLLCNLRIGDRGGVQGRKQSPEQIEQTRTRMLGNTYRRDAS
jgi:hypothetical protein